MIQFSTVFNFVNQRVNNAIRYTSDMTQRGTPNEWYAPLAAGKRAAGAPAKQLRVLLVHDNIARLQQQLCEDSKVRRITPLFALDDQGVKLLAVPYASRIEPKIEPKIEPMSEAVKEQDGKQERGGAEIALRRRSCRSDAEILAERYQCRRSTWGNPVGL